MCKRLSGTQFTWVFPYAIQHVQFYLIKNAKNLISLIFQFLKE